MTVEEFTKKSGVSEGEIDTKSYRSIYWNALHPVEWEEETFEPGKSFSTAAVRKRVTKLLVQRIELDYPDAEK
jgi:hypothetical protein